MPGCPWCCWTFQPKKERAARSPRRRSIPLKKGKPAAFYDPAYAARVRVGNFDDDLALLADCDWVIEAVTENLAIKQALLTKVVPHLKQDAILTTNTSGLPVASIAATLPEAVRRRWFGTHFFNPPRYMRLVEIIPTPEADPAAIAAISHFSDVLLGKEVVFARDTPNFIANRIGVFIMLEAVRPHAGGGPDHRGGRRADWNRDRLAAHRDLPPGRHGGHRRPGARGGELRGFGRDAAVRAVHAGEALAGDKTRQGFYKKTKDADGKELRQVLDWKTLEYVPAVRPKIPSLEMAKNAEKLPERLASCFRATFARTKRAIPLAPAQRPMELRGGLPAGDRRRRRQRGPRHARRLQLGNGSVPALGCGRRCGDRAAHGAAGERVSPIVERLWRPAPRLVPGP
jgi:3-hydroxyacyl-CoA dehydrogenase